MSKHKVPLEWYTAVIVGLCLAGAVVPATAQGVDADQLADEIALTEIEPATTEQGPANAATKGKKADGPLAVSVLDIGAKLALLVLLVYGASLGVKQLQKSGFRLGRPAGSGATEGGRIRQCADLALRGGATLHLVEVDRCPVLLATHGTGDVSLILDLRQTSASAPGREPVPHTTASVQPSAPQAIAPQGSRDKTEPRTAPILQQDSEWTQRRDALIRALTERAS